MRLCPARIPQVAWGSAGEAANAAYQWQKNLTAIFLTEKTLWLVPGSSNANVAAFSKAGTWAISWGTREPRSVRGSRLPWGRQGYVEAEEKCIFLSPTVPRFPCGREGWVNNPDFPHWSHSSLDQNGRQEQGALSVSVLPPGKSTFLFLPPLLWPISLPPPHGRKASLLTNPPSSKAPGPRKSLATSIDLM